MSAALFKHCIAAPSFKSSSLGEPSVGSRNLETAKRQDEEVLKYFHEPGYVQFIAILYQAFGGPLY
jgi:hypothetical protein